MSYLGYGRYIKPHWTADNSLNKWIKASPDEIHISAKALNIAWGNDSRFWQWVPVSKDNSCFETAAELVQVNWLHVNGTLDLAKYKLEQGRTYEIVYVINFKVDAFGWPEAPVTFQVVTPNGVRDGKSTTTSTLDPRVQWRAIPGGVFTAPSKMAGTLEFSMSETRTNWWKGGMLLEGVIIRRA